MFHIMSRTALAVVLAAVPALASSQVIEPLPGQSAAPEPEARPQATQLIAVPIPAFAPVELRVLDAVTSKTAVSGSPVRLALEKPLYATSELGLPAGTPVEGVVIHAAKGGMGGKSGELLIGAKRIILSGGLAIPLRSFKLGPAKGQNNEAIAMGAAIAGGAVGAVASMFIVGGSAEIPSGAFANAKTSTEIEVPVALLSKLPASPASGSSSQPEASPAPALRQLSTQGETK